MINRNEDVILNISSMKKNIEIKSNSFINSNQFRTKNNNYSNTNKKRNTFYKNDINFTSSETKELFKNSGTNYPYHSNNNINNNKINESIYPLKIKKMAKTDIIIKEEDPTKNNFVVNNSTNELTHENKQTNDINTNKNVNKRNKIKLREKKKNNKKEIKENKFICNICNKEYNIKNSFQKHLLTHKNKKYICKDCNKRFSVNSKLKRHLLTHSDIKEFKCELCEAAFNLKYNLKVHMRVHNNEKPYICGHPGCFAKFAQQNNLTTHLKIHSNNIIKKEEEINILLNYHNNILKFNRNNRKNLNLKLLELNKIALNG